MTSAIKDKRDNEDFLSGQTIIVNQERGWQGLRVSDWNMILTLTGKGEISSSGKAVTVSRGDLTLIRPDYPRHFYTDKNWNILWFHFLMHMYPEKITWPELVPGIYQIKLAEREFLYTLRSLREAHQLNVLQSKGWYSLVYNLLENALLRGNNQAAQNDRNIDDRIIRAQKLLLKHSDSDNIDGIAASCNMSRSAFYANFKRAIGSSPRKYRELQALRRAQQLLEGTQLSISEISDQIDMPNIYYFSNRFKKFSGLSPSAYRKSRNSWDT
ncbi:MAG: hypothetical protein A2020_09455 [Lentisphaerae bacterium GWF2_45_14]|nr:MAG: hypothetical protein A2020_09455 [Lentisphaerae bacterium GWF2_45_14]